MYIFQNQCPECAGYLLVNLSSLPLSQAQDGDKFAVTCPFCSSAISYGLVSSWHELEAPQTASMPILVEPSNTEAPASGGGISRATGGHPSHDDGPTGTMNPNSAAYRSSRGSGASRGSGPSPNDQRSNTLNPNNAAHRAAHDNRSNQMNPNNAAYRSSRGGRGGGGKSGGRGRGR